MIAIGSVIIERCSVVNRIQTVYAKANAPRPAGPLIRATTIPTAKFDADATHWSTIVVVARVAASPRNGHRILNRVRDMPVTRFDQREQGARSAGYRSWR